MSQNDSKLFNAAASNDLKGILDAFRQGAAVDRQRNANGDTALIAAAYRDSPNVVLSLLGLGADPSLTNSRQETARDIARGESAGVLERARSMAALEAERDQ